MKIVTHPGPKRTKRLILGYFFLTCGVLFGALPLVQGWLLFALGLLFLENDVRWARATIDWTKYHFRRSRPIFDRIEAEFDVWLKKFNLMEDEKNIDKR